MNSIFQRAIVMALACSMASCGPSENGESASAGHKPGKVSKPDRPLKILTTFYPAQYFTKRIGGALVDVTCPVPSDEDPIFWMPDAGAIQQYQAADMIVLNGAGFAKWIDKVSLPQSRILDTALPLESELIKFEDTVEHSHGKEGSHAHEGIDGHTWLDPLNAKVQAGEIRNALILRMPDAHEILEANFVALAADLDALDEQLKEIAAAGMPHLFGSHPAYNYIARRYGWQIVNLELDPGAAPDAKTVAAIREKMKLHPATHLLWESEPGASIADFLETEVGLKSLIFSPCELQDARGADYLTVMRQNIEHLRLILK
ncbi:MAG: zinc transport system substrate-binding protein [Verrucomicrobiales bacterium]|jgi:zinc transport system substrate-binding protein